MPVVEPSTSNDPKTPSGQKADSLNETLYGKQGQGNTDEKSDGIDPLTNREKIDDSASKPGTNPADPSKSADKDQAPKAAPAAYDPLQGRAMAVMPPDHSQETLDEMHARTKALREAADKNASSQPKMGDNGEGSADHKTQGEAKAELRKEAYGSANDQR